jgi:hypothetical protein
MTRISHIFNFQGLTPALKMRRPPGKNSILCGTFWRPGHLIAGWQGIARCINNDKVEPGANDVTALPLVPSRFSPAAAGRA